MLVAPLQLDSTMPDPHADQISNGNDDNDDDDPEDDDDDGDDDDISNMGQQVQAYIPDIVLNNLNDLIDRHSHISIPNEHTYANGTLLFLDVSGFTCLTEQYSNDAHLGIDQLTRTLNSYFAKLVYEILTHDGDIYKFAGDAILSLWTNENTGPQRALKCALHLQQKYGAYETDVGVVLRLKVALAYGPVRALFVGTDEFHHYLLTGDCVKNVNICEQLCEAGDIIITNVVHEKLQSTPLNCKFVPVREDIDPKHEHMAVEYPPLARKPTAYGDYEEESDNDDHIDSSKIIEERMVSRLPSALHTRRRETNAASIFLSAQEIINTDAAISENDLSDDALNLKVDALMKSFLLHCVYQRIERKQSLDYLSELRRVTISFINLDICHEQSINENLHVNLQTIFVHIYDLTKRMGGVLTKALLFDKGWSFLCVFGLPGYKQGDDTANALKSAQMIHSKIRSQCPFVDKCSIGVSASRVRVNRQARAFRALG